MVLEKKKKHISIRKEFSEKIFTPACMANPNWLYHQYSRFVELFSPEFCLKIGDTFVQAMKKPAEKGKNSWTL